MYRILNQRQLDASIQSLVTKKFDKFRDVKGIKGSAQRGIKGSLALSQRLMNDSTSDGYILTGLS